MYIDLMTRIKNAQAVGKETVRAPYSKMDEAVLGVLLRYEYIKGFEKKGRGAKRVLVVKLKYRNKKGAINGVKFISKPSRRMYGGYREIKPSRQGYGLMILSTSQGILTDKEAKKNKVGGELLFEIW